MSTALDWHLLRPLENSQQKAFEELCCQLAGAEEMPQGARFVRRGTPDAGIECYWELPNRRLYGWQAKFFRDIPKATQWRQIDESIKKALDNHRQLVEYTVCLPIDRADPRDPTKASFMDEWNAHVAKWTGQAHKQGMEVQFTYWGQSEICTRLSQETHRGRYYFWFNKELFSREWFGQKLDIAIENAGRRYLPSLTVALPVSGPFRGLGRTPEFFDEFDRIRGEIRRTFNRAMRPELEQAHPGPAKQLRSSVDLLLNQLAGLNRTDPSRLPFNHLREMSRTSSNALASLISAIRDGEGAHSDETTGGHTASYRTTDHNLYFSYQIGGALVQLSELLEAPESELANTPAALLVGRAGVGKTHLLCDVARKRQWADQCTLLLLGEQFSRDEPWSQIIARLGLTCGLDDFLGALNASGELRQNRTLIFIDALNEGEGLYLWPKFLAGFLKEVTRYPWLAVAVSVRQTYEEVIIPPGLVPDKLVRIRHPGFLGKESVAVTRFFGHYGIASPAVPLMQPEFSNPLFLRLFCEGIQRKGWAHVPSGLDNLTAVFDLFLDSVNTKLAGAEYLDYDAKDRLVQRAVYELAQAMARLNRRWLLREDARNLLDGIFPTQGFRRSLLSNLLSEGVVSEEIFPSIAGFVPGVRFSYERFSDHEIARFHLDTSLDRDNAESSFVPTGVLGAIVANESTCWDNAGIVSALAIQLPELIGRELPEVAPHCASFRAVREAVAESIMWRKHGAFSPATLDYLNKYLLRDPDTSTLTLQTLLSISTQPDHPYNADLLHRNLYRIPMAARDEWWSTFLHYQYSEEESPVSRILDWAELEEVRTSITDKSLFLMGTTLAWFLTSSNRFLRDRTTKALVGLFTKRLPVFHQVLKRFRDVNDLYVVERLLAVAYGCSMRCADKAEVGQIARWCYEAIFKNSPPVHILVRDYARGVIERAVHMGSKLDIRRSVIRPPYGAKWPRSIPSEAELKPLGEWEPDGTGVHPAQGHIYESVMGWGDFARYVIGTNSGFFAWKDLRLRLPRPPSREEIHERFQASLSERQQELWAKAKAAEGRYGLALLPFDLTAGEMQRGEAGLTEIAKLKKASRTADRKFYRSLTPSQARTYRALIRPRREPPWSENRFDLKLVQRFILKRVFELGWTAKRFGEFDGHVNSYRGSSGREAQKAERIGKKYQWLAYHEALARIADNFVFSEWWSHREMGYEGAWQVTALRDIDPSVTIRATARSRRDGAQGAWWSPKYDSWRKVAGDLAWLHQRRDLPQIEQVVQLKDPLDRTHWVTLEGSYHWEEPTPIDREWGEIPHRMIWYQVRSYIVRKENFDEVFEWAKRQNFMGRWMPESQELHNIFLGELFWAPAFLEGSDWAAGDRAWTLEARDDFRDIARPMVVTAQEYSWEGGGYDCSIDGSVGIHAPARWLVDGLKLHWNGKEGEFTRPNREVVARDPSSSTPGPPALLMRESVLRKFLRHSGCEMFWTILGEKNILMPNGPFPARNEISGAMAIRDKQITGKITTRFRRFK